ncbi:hypothetical protein PG999_012271 [Apiospora kogelbergensis]|uniref:ATPase family associated with various cellular activities (AAA) n=1 Tax=Apiospora kogelbergensis TaxID=1337665 RepID=A0AAW0QGP2_9PEZI
MNHLELFIITIQKCLSETITLRRSIREKQLEKISFSDLWHLFNPGDLVISQKSSATSVPRAYLVSYVKRARTDNPDRPSRKKPDLDETEHVATKRSGQRLSPLQLICLRMEYDGTRLGPVEYALEIPPFQDEKMIQDLPYFPKQFSQGDGYTDELLVLGRKFISSRYGHATYEGSLSYDDKFVEGEFFVDFRSAYEPDTGTLEPPKIDLLTTHTESCVEILVDKDADSKQITLRIHDDAQVENARYEKFKKNKLKISDVRMLSLPNLQREKSFESLVIPSKYKRMLKAVVENHAACQSNQEAAYGRDLDLLSGKGRGLIILLYGPPGVGKIQANLESHFRLAHRWNCVLLLDEADVYLVTRDITDLKRNGIVSVFLRTLEYYSGILFLTSNREGSIDEAFKSRIHMAFHYKRINKQGNVKIWENMLTRIEENNNGSDKRLPIKFDREKLIAWAKRHFDKHDLDSSEDPKASGTWNGRQIRNAFQTAIALAAYERLEDIKKHNKTPEQALKKVKWRKIELKPSHFKQVEGVVGDFQRYLNSFHPPDHVRSKLRGMRNDTWDGRSQQQQSAYPSNSATWNDYIDDDTRPRQTAHGWNGKRNGQRANVQSYDSRHERVVGYGKKNHKGSKSHASNSQSETIFMDEEYTSKTNDNSNASGDSDDDSNDDDDDDDDGSGTDYTQRGLESNSDD